MKKKKRAVKKKKAVKKPKKKKNVKKPGKKKAAAKPKKKPAAKRSIMEGVSLEEVGVVTHYFPHVEAAVIKLTKGVLSVGDSIIIKGHTTEFKESVDSMQLDRVPITNATIGQEIGVKVKEKVRDHDAVYKIIG